jgi:TATA-binding protein-associated factor
LKDVDDDVRTVAASTLQPIAGRLADSLSESKLQAVFDTLWDCLKNDEDELGSSVGAIMDLLGELWTFQAAIKTDADLKKVVYLVILVS